MQLEDQRKPMPQYPTVQSSSVFAVHSDIDERAENNGGCDANARCYNTYGSFCCVCEHGYLGDGFNCTGNDGSTLKTEMITGQALRSFVQIVDSNLQFSI